ncbi:MAG: TIGR02594 family protein [Pseudomonadota bacterium]|nr:TIGR02594 family protein [Pseudomonadota bacterium]
MKNDLSWMIEAKQYIGLAEIKGAQHNPIILGWLRKLKAWWTDDETPWCGTFIAAVLVRTSRGTPKHWYRAKAYLKWGTKLGRPAYGSIAVKSRKGGGHVFFVAGETPDGDIVGLGGNQGDKVSLARFSREDIIDYMWPPTAKGEKRLPSMSRYRLPVYTHDLQPPASEA